MVGVAERGCLGGEESGGGVLAGCEWVCGGRILDRKGLLEAYEVVGC